MKRQQTYFQMKPGRLSTTDQTETPAAPYSLDGPCLFLKTTLDERAGLPIIIMNVVSKRQEDDMPRPRKCRRVQGQPKVGLFKPQGVDLASLKGVVLPVEGLEALRLSDVEGLDQEQAAAMMGVSRPTFSRVLAEARAIVARALVNGWAIRIDGGDFEFVSGPGGAGAGRGRGRGHGGPGGKW
jgi:predicted DNA-binding protein (UPF0251 family)